MFNFQSNMFAGKLSCTSTLKLNEIGRF